MLGVFMTCHLLGFSSALLNPILYGYRNELMRNELKHILNGVMVHMHGFSSNSIFSYVGYRGSSAEEQSADATNMAGGAGVRRARSPNNGVELQAIRLCVASEIHEEKRGIRGGHEEQEEEVGERGEREEEGESCDVEDGVPADRGGGSQKKGILDIL